MLESTQQNPDVSATVFMFYISNNDHRPLKVNEIGETGPGRSELSSDLAPFPPCSLCCNSIMLQSFAILLFFLKLHFSQGYLEKLHTIYFFTF